MICTYYRAILSYVDIYIHIFIYLFIFIILHIYIHIFIFYWFIYLYVYIYIPYLKWVNKQPSFHFIWVLKIAYLFTMFLYFRYFQIFSMFGFWKKKHEFPDQKSLGGRIALQVHQWQWLSVALGRLQASWRNLHAQGPTCRPRDVFLLWKWVNIIDIFLTGVIYIYIYISTFQ